MKSTVLGCARQREHEAACVLEERRSYKSQARWPSACSADGGRSSQFDADTPGFRPVASVSEDVSVSQSEACAIYIGTPQAVRSGQACLFESLLAKRGEHSDRPLGQAAPAGRPNWMSSAFCTYYV